MDEHQCKNCGKCFPSGRSLGGHMRSHIKVHSTEAGGRKKKLAWPAGGSGESPKKMGRLSELGEHHPASSAGAMERKQCKECGREFSSSKALFGHMRSHSHKISRPSCLAERGGEQDRLEQDQEKGGEGSWSLKKLSQGSMSDDNASPADSRLSYRRKLESTVIQAVAAAAAAAAGSSSITAYEKEEADVAISLMMLSRDVSGFWAPSAESSDKHSLVLEDGELKQQSESGDSDCEHLEEDEAVAAADSSDEPKGHKTLHLGEFGEKRVRLDKKGKYLNAQESKLERSEPQLESKHPCTSCNRTFDTYQALGGHRASHKRIRGCCLPKPCASSDGTEDYTEQLKLENEASPTCPSNLSKTHECSICGKTFNSGQALGGHKRSHVVPNAAGSSQSDEVMAAAAEAKVPELLDLNFPAPIDEESSYEKTWRVCESIKFGHEQPLRSIW